jgi:hypothetical protein
MMTREQAIELVNTAIDLLVQNDSALFELDVTERSLSYRLAHYMELSSFVQPPLTVDCEYNRHFGDPKRLNLPPRNALDREIRATTVFPDILVHERNCDRNNLIVLELKKPSEEIAYDELKLRAFREELGYIHTAHIILGYLANNVLVRDVRWVDGDG